jgi:hypothetical protein
VDDLGIRLLVVAEIVRGLPPRIGERDDHGRVADR